ncbi:MAG: SRPBCC family protein [Acidimicrobiia bacterium]|nr:SRPBCC family protein [Acidimicrobiia bacterium]
MTVRIRVCTTIDASPADVWGEVERIDRHVEWMADAESISFRSARTGGVGAEFEVETRVGPLRTTDVMVVTEWRPRRAMGIVHRGVVTGTGRFTLHRRRGGRTRFCWEERLAFPWWMGGPVGERAARPVLRRIWRGNLRRLRARCETGRAAR